MSLAGLRPIAVTMGEPAGIAPDITLQAWLSLRTKYTPGFFVIGDHELLRDRAERLGIKVDLAPIETPSEVDTLFRERLPLLPRSIPRQPEPGAIEPANAQAVLASIESAVGLAIVGKISAVVTNPVQKSVLYQQGFQHTGHTDFIASLVRASGFAVEPVMMLAAPGIRTVPLTVHIPLRDVARSLSQEIILRQTRVVNADLKRYFGIVAPRIAMTGLNPHAGEGGALGEEERSIIIPALEILTKEGIQVEGPLPADSVFHDEARSRYDIVVCMFHDQALIPVKTIGFHQGVNATLGLPIVRTSPDHGTALSLAGTGRANPTSLICAIQLAAEMADHAQQRQ